MTSTSNKLLRLAMNVLPTQALIILCNFLAGLVLARELAPYDRGAVAVVSITIGFTTILAGAGLAELLLVHAHTPSLRSHFTQLSASWAAAVSGAAAVLTIVTGLATPLGGLAIFTTLLAAAGNLHVFSQLQLQRGLKSVIRFRCIYAAVSTAAIFCWLPLGLTRSHVYVSWMAAEVSLFGLAGATLLRTSVLPPQPLPTNIARGSLGFMFAQMSGMFVDRAMILIAAWAGGLGSAGGLTVFQNVAAPISAPVQAFSTAVLNGRDTPKERARIVKLVLAIAALAACTCACILPLAAESVWGPSYKFLGTYSVVVSGSGFLLAAWRLRQIQLRANKRPMLVLASDVTALVLTGVFASLRGIEGGLDICLLGLTFASTGWLTSLMVVTSIKPLNLRPRQILLPPWPAKRVDQEEIRR